MEMNKRQIEETERTIRVWEYLENAPYPLVIKDVQKGMGLSYRQTMRCLNRLIDEGVIRFSVTKEWNGCFYVYPHKIWLNEPPSL